MDGYLSNYNRPPWNYSFMLSGAWLSLVPSLAIMTGVVMAVKNPCSTGNRGPFFAAVCLFIYVAAVLCFFIMIPILSISKATYALGLTPCFALLAAGGFDMLTRRPFLRAVIHGIMICWALGNYLSYFVL